MTDTSKTPTTPADTVRKFNNDMAANPLWKIMNAVAEAVEDEADVEQDDGDDDFVRHVRFECRQGNFI